MPAVEANGITLNVEEYGSGEPVLLVAGTAAPGRVWKPFQVPALVNAGYRVITFDSRGVPPSDLCAEGFTRDDMTADLVGLIERLELGPCRIIGTSMGAFLTQELLVRRGDLVSQAVLMGTRGRNDALARAVIAAELEVFDLGLKLPSRYEAVVRVMQGLGRRVLRDEHVVQNWLDLFELSPIGASISRSQLLADLIPDRLESYRKITVPCLVMAFEDDLMTPPHMCREVADNITGSVFREIPGCGHFGYAEDPDSVNSAIIGFFAGGLT